MRKLSEKLEAPSKAPMSVRIGLSKWEVRTLSGLAPRNSRPFEWFLYQ
jgi:hypothetical protein